MDDSNHNNTEGQGLPHAGQPPEVLVVAIKKVLRPLVRLMLSYQITYPFLVSLLKATYVEVADKEFQVKDKRQSDSRINLLTGVHRKDVKRLRAESPEASVTPGNISTGAQLIAYWMGADEFVDASGAPRPLPLRSASASRRSDRATDTRDQPGFDELVEMVCKQDIRPRVILDEWLSMGIAHVDKDDRVVLNTGAFTPEKGFDEKAFFFGKNLHDHISAGAHNLLGAKPSYFDRSVYYDKLTTESVQQLSELANEVGMHALTTVNKRALALQKQDQNKSNTHYRMNFGIFNFNTSTDAGRTREDYPEQKSSGNHD